MTAHLAIRILGVGFFNGELDDAVRQALRGGLTVAPSGPGMAVDLQVSAPYREALQTAEVVLPDSGWMVLLWRACTGQSLRRHSGLAFLRAVLARPELKAPGAMFWVMPSEEEAARTLGWLRGQGFAVGLDDMYVAPIYAKGPIMDGTLIAKLVARRSRVVVLGIGGGVQERLGHALRAQLAERPAILCIGAAIAFLSGGQATIPPWADRLFLGWLLRLGSAPRQFWRRYWLALRLAPLVWRYREQLPPLKG
jgi:UDP-N-acetyl-D-mannosaminuronic acid transferase (WecB/TagA/CpsF family)